MLVVWVCGVGVVVAGDDVAPSVRGAFSQRESRAIHREERLLTVKRPSDTVPTNLSRETPLKAMVDSGRDGGQKGGKPWLETLFFGCREDALAAAESWWDELRAGGRSRLAQAEPEAGAWPVLPAGWCFCDWTKLKDLRGRGAACRLRQCHSRPPRTCP